MNTYEKTRTGRSGKLYAQVTVGLDVDMWHRVDALAEKHGKTRHAMSRIIMEKGVEALEEESA